MGRSARGRANSPRKRPRQRKAQPKHDVVRAFQRADRDGVTPRFGTDVRPCHHKRLYTKPQAVQKARERTSRDGVAWDWYRCPACKQHHVGHRPDGATTRAEVQMRQRGRDS